MLTLREHDLQNIITANQNAVRSSSFSQLNAQLLAVLADRRLFDVCQQAGKRKPRFPKR